MDSGDNNQNAQNVTICSPTSLAMARGILALTSWEQRTDSRLETPAVLEGVLHIHLDLANDIGNLALHEAAVMLKFVGPRIVRFAGSSSPREVRRRECDLKDSLQRQNGVSQHEKGSEVRLSQISLSARWCND